MKKSKGQTIDLFYTNNKEINQKTRKQGNKKNKEATGKRSQKRKTNSSNKKRTNNEDTKIINLDNEIIIGLTPKKEEPRKTKKSENKGKNNNRLAKNKKTNLNKKNSNNRKTTVKKQNQKRKRKNKIIKWIILLLLLLIAVGLFMMSSVFNIKQIVVVNNSKVKEEEIIKLSTLTTDINMFKIVDSTIKNGIKTNAYVEDVNITRSFNGTVTLNIEERIPTYMLKFANSYVYINNQGYMLEMSENALELPMITGFKTPTEEIKEGNRLTVEDLKKLEDVIKIMETAKIISMDKIITEIDITNLGDYKLTIESEGKVIQFGDCSNINIKLLKVKEILIKEKGIEGEIYFQDLEKTVFREKV